ncbi:glycosyltransferase family 2 protein [bacterium]|nr:glycosyltransferase family 2 protein [bacterium]
MDAKNKPRYVIVTPARNEEAHISFTLGSMVAQTLRPVKWVIVDDGSTDHTSRIIREYATKFDFIETISSGGSGKPSFGSKVAAFRAGCERLAGLDYDFIGNIDGDVSFLPDYFETVIGRMQAEPQLGLAGGLIMEKFGDRFRPQAIAGNSVAGAVQLFRRNCFEFIGGYQPMDIGGIDALAEIMARSHGWGARTFRDLPVYHYGRVTTGGRNMLASRFRKGIINYHLGYHPLFQIAAGCYRMLHPPLILGGTMMIGGYCWAALTHAERNAPPDVVEYLRHEQIQRLRHALVPGIGHMRHKPGV